MVLCFISMDVDIGLFSNTKIPKNIPQNLVGGDVAGDGAEVVEGFAQVLGKKVGGEGGVQAFAYAGEACLCLGEGLDMTGVGDHGAVFLEEILDA